jgi:alkylation response protein AidB-like acyl-CoA dehydrogenase
MTGAPEARHQNLSWFMVDADSEGITIQPQYLMSTVGEGEGDVGHKNTVYFLDVKVPVDSLVGGENQGWKVASTHLELEHGAAGNINRDRFWDKLFSYCTAVKGDRSTLIEDQNVRETLAEVYIRLETNRVLSMRNFWLLASGGRRTYEGSQVTYLKKVTGLWMTREILDALGPEALTNDAERGALDGFAEEQQREGIVNMHPGGTTDIHRLIIARRLGLGRRHPEEAGSVI